MPQLPSRCPIDILEPTSKTVDALMLMRQLPSGVDIEIKF